MNRPVYLFLIGGTDLEILTTKRLLTENGFSKDNNIADRHLTRGAKLRDYQDLFNNEQSLSCIELSQIVDSSPDTEINPGITSNTFNHTLYPSRIPGCGLNKNQFK